MRILTLLAPILLFACVACGVTNQDGKPERILFVGNSLTYVGNVPAVYAALATVNGHPVTSYMIVRGGATLSQRVEDGSVAKALAARTYTTLVLQERGGDLICAYTPDTCIKSQEAIKALAALGRKHGVAIVLLGTYQTDPISSRKLVEGEALAAAEARIPYIEVSEKLRHLRSAAPKLTWFAADGIHPGKDLALLDALLVYRTLQGAFPNAGALAIKAPIYGSTSGLTATLRRADAPPPLPKTPSEVHYASGVLETLLNDSRRADNN